MIDDKSDSTAATGRCPAFRQQSQRRRIPTARDAHRDDRTAFERLERDHQALELALRQSSLDAFRDHLQPFF